MELFSDKVRNSTATLLRCSLTLHAAKCGPVNQLTIVKCELAGLRFYCQRFYKNLQQAKTHLWHYFAATPAHSVAQVSHSIGVMPFRLRAPPVDEDAAAATVKKAKEDLSTQVWILPGLLDRGRSVLNVHLSLAPGTAEGPQQQRCGEDPEIAHQRSEQGGGAKEETDEAAGGGVCGVRPRRRWHGRCQGMPPPPTPEHSQH